LFAARLPGWLPPIVPTSLAAALARRRVQSAATRSVPGRSCQRLGHRSTGTSGLLCSRLLGSERVDGVQGSDPPPKVVAGANRHKTAACPIGRTKPNREELGLVGIRVTVARESPSTGTFQTLKRAALGFRDSEQNKDCAGKADGGVDEECAGGSKGMIKQGEGIGEGERSDP